ncbi:DUF3159 domain-containing protein [Tsukamurella sp. PLM1]|uniref:DUF3159 domain-containing protein n=1 Tax=Tsukamurella sp. PLM1 TaxID=2929795 RepID=UPI0020C01388|nr:DUF3159 domain-containing protein [Tsukamurella sp. PLM1]
MTDGAEQDARAAARETAEPSQGAGARADGRLAGHGVLGPARGGIRTGQRGLGLTGGAIAALAVAAIVAVVRIATRSSIQPAISGFFGVAVCVVIAMLVGGNGKGYFLYGIVMQAVFAVAFAVSLLVRRPLVGVLWHLFSERKQDADGAAPDAGAAAGQHDWRADRRQYRAFAWLTVLWFVMFVVRFGVQYYLYVGDNVGGLGVARILMGWPMFAVGVLITFLVARRLTHAHGE